MERRMRAVTLVFLVGPGLVACGRGVPRSVEARSAGEIAPARGNVGAIAVSGATTSFGWAADYATREQAESEAVSRCGVSDCRAVVWFTSSCAAVVKGEAGVVHASWAKPDRRSAEQAALAACARTSPSCTPVAWACTSGTSPPHATPPPSIVVVQPPPVIVVAPGPR
jgi:hypothetical protein